MPPSDSCSESHSATKRDALQRKMEKHESLYFLHDLFGYNAAQSVAYMASIALCIQGTLMGDIEILGTQSQ